LHIKAKKYAVHVSDETISCPSSITGSDAGELNELRAWFSKNLERPTSFGRDKLRLGICWFKTGSTEHISRIWEMVNILERNGIYVKKIRTDRPGYVIYEDEWQLVAEPFRKGAMPRRSGIRTQWLSSQSFDPGIHFTGNPTTGN
jgi:hypothetical protein